jgi:UDP:flavonoid glycosyltransferase YjiC (YdhE family)
MVRNPGLLPNRESVKAGDIGKRRKEMWDIITGSWRSCIEAGDGMGEGINAANVPDAKDLFIADAIIANPPSMAHIHCAERLSIPLHMVFTMPWSPTQTFSHPLASMKIDKDTSRTTANYFSFMMMELLTWQGLGDLINKFRTRILCIDPISPMWGYQLLARLQVPYSYLWSQTLIPKPPDWGSHINITGFSFLRLGTSYTPDPELAAFLQEGPAPIYIGFGSIVVKDSDAFTKLILKAVEISGVRALVSKGWGGFSVDNIPKNVFFLGNVPHDWLFQHVSAVVHHGGAGTTAAGIAAGRPTVIVPFFGDQPFWGQMIARAGAGPSPIPFKDMTAESLAASIHFALKPEVQEAVHRLADQIDSEDGAVATAADFQERLELDQLRCDIYPDRLAIWSHKGTGAHLSSFAAGSLVVAREIKSKDLKLMRKRHWYVDEGAEHPLIGAIAAFTGLGSALGAATSEFKNRVRRRQKLTNTTVTNEIDLEQTADKEPTVPTPQAQRQIPITDMERFARKIATKSLHGFEMVSSQLPYKPTLRERRKAFWAGKEKGRYGKQFYLLRATGRLTADVTKACLETPVAFFYNVANGFHNYPSYSLLSIDVRRRDEITDLSSGLQIAGKEFVVGLFDAFTGLVVKPYQGWQKDGAKGFGKGIAGGGLCLVYGLGACKFQLHRAV